MNIANFFKPAQAAQAPAQQPAANQPPQNANNGGQAMNQNSQTGPNNQPPANNQNAQPAQPVNPLDSFSKMWDNPSTEADTPPAFNLDPKQLGDIASKQDFMQGIDPELMTKATSGDVNAMMQLMNKVAQGAYAKSLEHGGMLTDKFVGARETHSSKGLGGRVRQELTQHALSDTPSYQHPVVRKQLTQIAEQLQRQNPDASPQEIAKQAKDYLNELVSAINPKTEDKAAKKAGPTNWDAYFDEASAED